MAKTVKIITDSAADLADNMAKLAEIEVVPLSIRFGDQEFTDGVELSNREFWDRLLTSDELPATSAPSPGAFETAFKQAASDGFESVVCLTISNAISGTYQIAVNAAKTVADSIPVHVIDTQACAIAQTTLVLEAANLANTGAPAQEIVDHIEELRTRVHLVATLDTLEYLKKNGRIGSAGAFFGSLLSIKPIVGLVDGKVAGIGRARTRSKAIDQLLSLVAEQGEVSNVIVGHSYAPDVDDFARRVRETSKANEVPVAIIGPVVGTHTGPRLLAVSFVSPKA
jgi:DegV family protein with EDD domain